MSPAGRGLVSLVKPTFSPGLLSQQNCLLLTGANGVEPDRIFAVATDGGFGGGCEPFD
jgi:hypothetical protein